MEIFCKYFHFKVIRFDTLKLVKFVIFLHDEHYMQKLILCIFDEFWRDIESNIPKTRQNFQKPVFPVELRTKLKHRLCLCFSLNWTIHKTSQEFYSPNKGKFSFSMRIWLNFGFKKVIFTL